MPSARMSVRLLLATLLLVACARSPAPPSITEFRGYYTPGFEVSRFVACNAPPADQPWWVVLSGHALQQRDSALRTLSPTSGARVFVRWRAALGARGETGHLGQSTRHIQVMELLELRPPGDGDCPRN